MSRRIPPAVREIVGTARAASPPDVPRPPNRLTPDSLPEPLANRHETCPRCLGICAHDRLELLLTIIGIAPGAKALAIGGQGRAHGTLLPKGQRRTLA
jgi:hypothetical protein